MPHFVVSEFHGQKQYAVYYRFTPRSRDGELSNVIEAIQIPEYVAQIPLVLLIAMYHGKKPIPTATFSPLLLNMARLILTTKKDKPNATATENIGTDCLRVESGHTNSCPCGQE